MFKKNSRTTLYEKKKNESNTITGVTTEHALIKGHPKQNGRV